MLARFILFQRELIALWHAFWAPQTPLYLKVATLMVVAYVLSPIDLIPDVLPILGLIDDVILVPFAVHWIVSRLPVGAPNPAADHDGPTIDGRARRK